MDAQNHWSFDAETNSLPEELLQPVDGKTIAECTEHWELFSFLTQNLKKALDKVSRMQAFIHPSVRIPQDRIKGIVILEEGVIIGPDVEIVGPVWIKRNTIIEAHSSIIGTVSFPDGKVTIQPVVIDENCWIKRNVEIVGSWVGKGSTIDSYSSMQYSYVGENAMIGKYTAFNRCIVGNKVRAHRADFEDSFIGAFVTLGLRSDGYNTTASGTVFSVPASGGEPLNTLLPHYGQFIGKRVFVAGHTSMQPGIFIGEETVIQSSCLTIYKNIPGDMCVSLEEESRQVLKITPRKSRPSDRVKSGTIPGKRISFFARLLGLKKNSR